MALKKSIAPAKRRGNYFERLPEDINVEILSRLPLPNVFQAQSVCHSWRTIIRSFPQFHKLWEEKNSEQWLVMDDCDGGIEIFNPNRDFKKKMFDSSSWILKAANGGLLLYLNETDGIFQVINPLTMEARQLPNPILREENPFFYLKIKLGIIDLIVDSTTKSYQVIVIGGSNQTSDLLIFRSTTSSWEIKLVEFSYKAARITDWTPYKTVGNQTVHCFPLQGHAQASYNLCGEIVHANQKHGGGSRGLVMGKNVKAAIWKPPIGRNFVFIFELDEASCQWQVVCVCRWGKAPFSELLCEEDFVLSCLGASKDCIWIIPAFSNKDVYQTRLMLQQQKNIFKSHKQDKSRAFPIPLRFSLCP
ncbi:hypothetical protein SUGI_0347650 [Cryptomeria japonica]|uniref:uncharacterized protein LOC131056838 n=1 Tax=Cryptomeria japonica TaxID=3369 RepID=UPI002408AD76|nr:uncharacterized protein LOC131056838 [Cryptomeria japonica]GLJ19311.1 hypothetical protein SUGI_0347650 [Cryptomeria japonica]